MPKVLVFGGTTESLAVLEILQKFRIGTYISVATEYGKECIGTDERVNVICGRMDREEMAAFMRKNPVDLVIDATHPFAVEVSGHIQWACRETKTEYIRCLRERTEAEKDKTDSAVYAASIQEAVEYLKSTRGNILITTGSKELKRFCEIPDYRTRCYARVLSVPDSVESSAACGFSGRNLIAMRAPFSKEMNIATIHYADASYFVTKETGDAGGMWEKIQACQETGATLVVIRRPEEEGCSVEEIRDYLEMRYEKFKVTV